LAVWPRQNQHRTDRSADAVFLALLGYDVMAGHQENPKSPLFIRRERGDDRLIFVFTTKVTFASDFELGVSALIWPP
jgi:hypothetical protein